MISRFKTTITSALAEGGSETTLGLASVTTNDGQTIAITDFPSGKIRLTINPDGSTAEDVYGTGISSLDITGLARGLSEKGDDTSIAANKHVHYPGETVIISNPGNFLKNDLVTIGGTQAAISGAKTFTGNFRLDGGTVTLDADNIPTFDATPTISNDLHVATKKYADDLAIAGAPNGTATVKGIYELATIAEASANAAAGSGDTTAALTITTALTSNTSGAAQIIPVTDADGDIPVEFMELDAIWAFAGANTHAGAETFNSTANIATASNWQLASTAFTGSMANLNEAATFFQSTDISATEAEDLTDGGQLASQLHYHFYASGSGTRATGAGTGNETIAHGMGVVPRFIRIRAERDAGTASSYSVGTATTTSSERCMYNYNTGAAVDEYVLDASNIVHTVNNTPDDISIGNLTTLDATNIVINFTTFINPAPNDGLDYIWEAFG